MSEGIVVVDYDPQWRASFADLGTQLRSELGTVALRIDHIGSTAVAGLAAKPIIDVQVSVGSFEPLDRYRRPLERAGFVHRAENPERTKRYFRERPGTRRTHIHVRRAGSFSEQLALLFREYLRCHPVRCEEYAALKRSLAEQFAAPDQRHEYVEAKSPFVWEAIRRADSWAQSIGWEPPPSDC
ncbi:MAG: GrpB family protein [Actinomycetota bacterium]